MLITVRDACTVQENALDVRVSDQIEQLDELITAEGNGATFFARTHITAGMRVLITEGLARLGGRSTQAIFHLRQALGGGKTHLLVAFGLLAQHPDLRAQVCPEIEGGRHFDRALVAAFNGRNNPDQFFWGEVAQQLGKAEQFSKFWTAGPRAPEERDWLALFEGDAPILILLDEMPPYFHYLDTQKVGNGTVADIATRALANLFTAAGKRSNVCVVVSDLNVVYETGSKLINRALEDARGELGRQERNITPVDLASDEVYDILRKRLFRALPDAETIDDIATAFARSLDEASRAKAASRGAEAIAEEIAHTYPFHPRLKNLVALFKENEGFKQTRGLMELVSRLLKSVWQRPTNDVFLIGPQHFDLGITEVREKLVEISGMGDVIAKDLWDANRAAHAQMIDGAGRSDAAAQVAATLLTASLSTAINAVKGLTKLELVECLVTPLRQPSEFLTAFEALENDAWYLHHTSEGRYYFDRQENLTKLLRSLAEDAPEPVIDDLIRRRLKEMFEPRRKLAYQEMLALPQLQEVTDRLRRGRVLVILPPGGKLPTVDLEKYFASLTQKNNLCILTGDKTQMASLDEAARNVFAAQKADVRIPVTHPQRADLEKKQELYEQSFTAVALNLFDKVVFPIQLPGAPARLVSKPLDMTRDAKKPFDGEEQIEKTLKERPPKLYDDMTAAFDTVREKAEDLLWPQQQDEARWADIADRLGEQPAMPWLPPKGLEEVRTLACSRGLWEELGNDYITKRPKPKRTSVQVIADGAPDDNGQVRLRVNAQHAGPQPILYYAEDGDVSPQSPRLTEPALLTRALRVTFLAVDPTGVCETGDPVTWSNRLVIRNRLTDEAGERRVELLAAPRGDLRYTLDGSTPRDGQVYTAPVTISDGDVVMRVFASADHLEATAEFRFGPRGKKGVQIDEGKSVYLADLRSGKKLDSRANTFAALADARTAGTTFEQVTLEIGANSRAIRISVGDLTVTPGFIETLLNAALTQFDPTTPISMIFMNAHFATGHDLKQFADKYRLDIRQEEIRQ